MKKVLFIEVSPRGADSASRKVGNEVLAELKRKSPDLTVVRRDLNDKPVPHVSAEALGAIYTKESERTSEQKQIVADADDILNEFLSVNTVVIATPMWNFSVPSVLKAWIDHIVRAGKTFEYTDKGPKGLVEGKNLIIVVSTGGIYSEGQAAAFDHLAPYLKSVFAFLGITDTKIIRAEGTNDPRFSATAVDTAIQTVKKVLA